MLVGPRSSHAGSYETKTAMKSKRRQELRTNDLAHALDQLGGSFRVWGVYVIGAIAVAAVGTLIFAYMKSARQTAMDESYTQLQKLLVVAPAGVRKSDEKLHRSIARIGDLSEKSTDPAFKIDALIKQGEMALDLAVTGEDGIDVSFLKEGREAFEAIVSGHRDLPIHYGRALFGLFQIEANEFAVDGDLAHRDAAEGHLEKLRDDSRLAGVPLQTMAIDKLNELDEIFTKVVFQKRPTPAVQTIIPKVTTIPKAATPPTASVTIGEPAKDEAVGSGDSGGSEDSGKSTEDGTSEGDDTGGQDSAGEPAGDTSGAAEPDTVEPGSDSTETPETPSAPDQAAEKEE